MSNIITMKLPHSADISQLLPFRKQQSTVARTVYSFVSSNPNSKEIEIRQHVNSCLEDYLTSCDSWLVQSALRMGKGQADADIALDKVHRSPKPLSGRRIFGGRKNFMDFQNKKITKEQYSAKRLSNFYSVGEAPQYGNRKVNFLEDRLVIKPRLGIAVEILLPDLRGKYKEYYTALILASTNKELPITVSVSDSHVLLSFDPDKLTKRSTPIKGRHLGVDVNPNYIGISYFDENHTILDTQLFDLSSLTGKHANHPKLKHEIREIAHAVVRKANHFRIDAAFVENLGFKQGDNGLGKNYNRLCGNQFLYTEFFRILGKFIATKFVVAAYSSTVGNVLNPTFPDPVASSIEIARRGYQYSIMRNSRGFYPNLPKIEDLQRRWKDVVFPIFKTWIEIHEFLKDTRLRYRVPFDTKGFESISYFKSKKSNVKQRHWIGKNYHVFDL